MVISTLFVLPMIGLSESNETKKTEDISFDIIDTKSNSNNSSIEFLFEDDYKSILGNNNAHLNYYVGDTNIKKASDQ